MSIRQWRMVQFLWERFLHVDINEELQLENEYLREENLILKQQLEKNGTRLRLCDAERFRLVIKAIALGKRLFTVVTIVRPETILGWHRKLVAHKFDGSKQREYPGRPPIKQDIETELLRFAGENPSWGYRRIAGALRNLGFTISDATVANIMRRNDLPPSGARKSHGMTWRQFIQLHCHLIWATDFFTVEAWTHRGLVTFYVLFFIHLKTRKITLGGVTASPNGEWMAQVARNLTGYDGALAHCRYLIHDRGSQYTQQFDEIMKSIGIKPIRLPPRSPNLNAFAERFVLSVKTECLSRFIPLGEASLRYALKCYMEHYHTERNHQGLGNTIPFPGEEVGRSSGPIRCRERLAGLLRYYFRDAA